MNFWVWQLNKEYRRFEPNNQYGYRFDICHYLDDWEIKNLVIKG